MELSSEKFKKRLFWQTSCSFLVSNFGQHLFLKKNFSKSCLSSLKAMPKGTKRKREDADDPQPRRSNRERKRTSFGEDFVELFSPPKNPASSKGSSQSGPSTSSARGVGGS